MATAKLRKLDTSKILTPYELELINWNFWAIESALSSIGALTPNSTGTSPATIPIRHDQLTELDDDDHLQYLLLNGRAGGQIIRQISTDPVTVNILKIGPATGSTGYVQAAIDDTVLLGAHSALGAVEFGMIVGGYTDTSNLDSVIAFRVKDTGARVSFFYPAMQSRPEATVSTAYTSKFDVGDGIVFTTRGTPYGTPTDRYIFNSFYGQPQVGDPYSIVRINIGPQWKGLRLRYTSSQDKSAFEIQDSSGITLGGFDENAYVFSRQIKIVGSVSGNALTLISNASTATYSLTFPAAQGVTGQTLVHSATPGILEWGTAGSSTSLFSNRASQNLTSVSQTIVVTDGTPITPITSNGTYTLTAVPTIASGREGQLVILINVGAYNITIQDLGTLGGSNIRLSSSQTGGTRTLIPFRSICTLIYNSTYNGWCEASFNDLKTFTPSISSFTVNVGTGASAAVIREIASALSVENAPVFAMTYVGVPTAATIDINSGEINPSDYPSTVITPFTSHTGPTFYKGSTIGAVRQFTINATVSGSSVNRTCTVTYYNSRYGGINTKGTALTSAETVALGIVATDNSKYGSFAANATGANYFWYCYRSLLGTVTYWSIDNERAAFTRIGTGTVSVTNASGYSETFEQYRSNLTGLGNRTVEARVTEANNRVYCGPNTATQITTGGILTLDDTADGSSRLANIVTGTYSIRITGSNYLWICHPDAINDINFVTDLVTGFQVGGSYQSDVSHTNDMGYTENYRCWRSTNPGIFPSTQNISVTSV